MGINKQPDSINETRALVKSVEQDRTIFPVSLADANPNKLSSLDGDDPSDRPCLRFHMCNVAWLGLNLDFDAANFDETQPLERSMTWPGPPDGSAPAASNSSGSVRAAKADAGWYPGAAPRPADAPASRPEYSYSVQEA